MFAIIQTIAFLLGLVGIGLMANYYDRAGGEVLAVALSLHAIGLIFQT